MKVTSCLPRFAGRFAGLARGTCRFGNDHTKYRVRELPEFLDRYSGHEVQGEGHKKVLVLRHGQSVGNQKELLYGSTDFELTAKGRKQAEQMREHMKALVNLVDTVTSSTKRRAVETAKIVFDIDTPLEELRHGHSQQHGAFAFRVDNRLDEFDLGGLEGIDVSALTFAEQETLNKL